MGASLLTLVEVREDQSVFVCGALLGYHGTVESFPACPGVLSCLTIKDHRVHKCRHAVWFLRERVFAFMCMVEDAIACVSVLRVHARAHAHTHLCMSPICVIKKKFKPESWNSERGQVRVTICRCSLAFPDPTDEVGSDMLKHTSLPQEL